MQATPDVVMSIDDLDRLLSLRDKLTYAQVTADHCGMPSDCPEVRAAEMEYNALFGKLTGGSPQ